MPSIPLPSVALLLSAAATAPVPAAAAPWNASKWELVLLTEAAKTAGAVCLDGSPGGYQIRPGKPGNDRWVVFHQGGGWCNSDENCAARANTALGSSNHPNKYSWGATYSDPYEGSQLFLTPPFDTATLVYALYCDGGSWAGNATAPVMARPNSSAPMQKVFYRGRPLLDALYTHLLGAGLSSASELLFGGCSAGALTVYMHADYVASRMPRTVKVVALADAMFSIDTPDAQGSLAAPERFAWIFTGMNCSGSVNQECLRANPNGTACMFGASTAPFVKTPLFVLNSKFDTWQAGGIIGAGKCGSKITTCPPAIQSFWKSYGMRMVETLKALPPQHGGFLSNCQAHCQAGSGAWHSRTIDGTSMGGAFTSWYNTTMAALRVGGDSDDDDGLPVASRRLGNSSTAAHRYYEACDSVTTCGADRC
jgi:hypothetical protein